MGDALPKLHLITPALLALAYQLHLELTSMVSYPVIYPIYVGKTFMSMFYRRKSVFNEFKFIIACTYISGKISDTAIY